MGDSIMLCPGSSSQLPEDFRGQVESWQCGPNVFAQFCESDVEEIDENGKAICDKSQSTWAGSDSFNYQVGKKDRIQRVYLGHTSMPTTTMFTNDDCSGTSFIALKDKAYDNQGLLTHFEQPSDREFESIIIPENYEIALVTEDLQVHFIPMTWRSSVYGCSRITDSNGDYIPFKAYQLIAPESP